MAAPTQQYPPWLTPIPSVIVDANGVPITTSTTVLFLPLTYYGPSIPLDPDWTDGGLTSPVSTSTPSTTAIPTTTSSSSSITTAIPSSSTPVTSFSTSTSSFISSTFPTSTTSTPAPTQSNGTTSGNRLTRGQLVGVIVASILGFIFLLVLILAIYLFCKGKRRRRSRAVGAPIDDDYFVVGGSPRHSGEEADPFLVQRRGGGGGGGGTQTTEKTVGSGTTTHTEIGTRPPQPPPKNVARVPPPPATTITSLGSSNSSSTNSGYGEPLAQPTLGIRPIREEHEQEMSGGAILSPEEMQRLDQETVLPPTGEQEENGGQYSGAYAYRAEVPLLPPPKLVDPATRGSADFTLPRPPFAKKASSSSHRSSLPLDADENATLLTARRVRVEDLGPRSSPGSSPVEANTSKPSTSSFLGSLGAIAGRLSWRRSERPRTSQHQPLLQSSPLSDQDLEQGRLPSVSPAPQMSESARSRGGVSVGVGPDGTRPISSVSGRSQNSGGTIYHDAASSLPGTPPLAPLPRAATPSDIASAVGPPPSITRPSMPSQLSQSQTAEPPSYEDQPPTSQAGSPGGTSYAQGLNLDFDILDLPAPSAIFNAGSNPSLQASSTSDATVVNRNAGNSGLPSSRPYVFPPGLDTIPQPKAWSELSNEDTASPGSYGVDQDMGAGTGITIDVLEEEPPTAGEGWRSMATAASTGGIDDVDRLAKRTTFGLPTYVPGVDLTSEQGSLHSMRSHVGPSSPPRSTGSAAASTRRELSYGSSSSRPSAAARSTGTGGSGALSFAQSLARSGSITSDGRRRGHGHISPALSAFGNRGQDGSGSGSGSGSDFVVSREGSGSGSGSASGLASESVVLQSPTTAYLGPERAASTASTAMSSPPLVPLSMPWAGGLDDAWTPAS